MTNRRIDGVWVLADMFRRIGIREMWAVKLYKSPWLEACQGSQESIRRSVRLCFPAPTSLLQF